MEREIINKLGNVLNEIRNMKDISTFVIIRRENDGLWDIVIGGPKLDTRDNLNNVASVLNKILSPNELKIFSRIVLLSATDSFISNLRKTFSVGHGDMELQNAQVNNIFIKHAYLLYSK